MATERMRPAAPGDGPPPGEAWSGPAPRWRRWAALAGWSGIAMIVVLSLVPGSQRPHTPAVGQVEHAVAYALAFGALALGSGRRRAVALVAAASALGALLEALQIVVPGRQAQLIDVWAGAAGAVLGVLGSGLVPRLFPPGLDAPETVPTRAD